MPQPRLDEDGIVRKLYAYIVDQRDTSIQRLCTVTSAFFTTGALLGIQSDASAGPAGSLLADLKASPGVRVWVSLLRSLIASFSSIHTSKLMISSRFLSGLSRGIAEIVPALDTLQAEVAIPAIRGLATSADTQRVLVRVARVYSNQELRNAQMDALTFLTEPFQDVAVSVRLLLIAMLLRESEGTTRWADALQAIKNILYHSVLRALPVTLELIMRIFLQEGLLHFAFASGLLDLFLVPQWVQNASTCSTLLSHVYSFYLITESLSRDDLLLRFLVLIKYVRGPTSSSESTVFRLVCSRAFRCADDPGPICQFLLMLVLIKLHGKVSADGAKQELRTYVAELHSIYTSPPSALPSELMERVPLLTADVTTGRRACEMQPKILKDTIRKLVDLPAYWVRSSQTNFPHLSLLHFLVEHGELECANLLVSMLFTGDMALPPEHLRVICTPISWLAKLDMFKTDVSGESLPDSTRIPIFLTSCEYARALDASIDMSDYEYLGRVIANLFCSSCPEVLSYIWVRVSAMGFDNKREIYRALYAELKTIAARAGCIRDGVPVSSISGMECVRQFYYSQFVPFTERYLISALCPQNSASIISNIMLLPPAVLLLVCENVKKRIELADIRGLLCTILLSAHPLLQEFYVWLFTESICAEFIDDLILQQEEKPVQHFSAETGWIRSYYRNYIAVVVRLSFHVDSTISASSPSLSTQHLLDGALKSLKYGSIPAMYCLREIITYLTNILMCGKTADLSFLASSTHDDDASLASVPTSAAAAADAYIQSIGERSLPEHMDTVTVLKPLLNYLLVPENLRPFLEFIPSGRCWSWAMSLQSISTYEQISELINATFNELIHFIAVVVRTQPDCASLAKELCDVFSLARCSYLPHAELLAHIYFSQFSVAFPFPPAASFLNVLCNLFKHSLSSALDFEALKQQNPFSDEDLLMFSSLSLNDANELIRGTLLPLLLYSTPKVLDLSAFLCGTLIKGVLAVSPHNVRTSSFVVRVFMQLIAALTFATRQNSTKISRSFSYLLMFLDDMRSEEGATDTGTTYMAIVVLLFYSLTKAFEVTQAQFVLLGVENCMDLLKAASPVLFGRFVYEVASMCDSDNNNVYIKAFCRRNAGCIAEAKESNEEELGRHRERYGQILDEPHEQLLAESGLTKDAVLEALLHS